jgi:hypothetical protein
MQYIQHILSANGDAWNPQWPLRRACRTNTYNNLFPTSPSLSSPSPSSSLHLSSSPTAKMVSPSKLSLGSEAGFLGIGAGSGLSSRCRSMPDRCREGNEPPANPPPLLLLESLSGGVRLPCMIPSSRESSESRTELISKPSSSCDI